MLEFTSDAENPGTDGWFVYLLVLIDCTAFKVGFTCNPLQRLHAFNRRYFDVVDLDESVLLRVPTIAVAREFEAHIKSSLAPYRIDAPIWLAPQAGGHTEWFSAVYFRDAVGLLTECATGEQSCVLVDLRSLLESVLLAHREQFERWLMEETQQIEMLAQNPRTLSSARERKLRLRDWWHAYERFRIEVFAERPDVRTAIIRYLVPM